MNPVFDINELPNRRLMVRQMVALHPHMDIGEAVHCIRRDMVMKLAYTILEKDDFFYSIGSTSAGVSYVEYGADCVVLTREEFMDVQRKAFTKGVEHSRGYTRTEP